MIAAATHRLGMDNEVEAGVTGNVRSFVGDMGSLLHLHAQLLQAEIAAWRTETAAARAAIAIGAVMSAAALPLALAGVAAGIYEYGGLSLTASIAIASLGGMTLGIAMGIIGWRILSNHPGPLRRTMVEVTRNMDCLLHGQSSAAPRGKTLNS